MKSIVWKQKHSIFPEWMVFVQTGKNDPINVANEESEEIANTRIKYWITQGFEEVSE